MEKSQLKIELRSEEIFPNGFSLDDFERSFEENKNIVKHISLNSKAAAGHTNLVLIEKTY